MTSDGDPSVGQQARVGNDDVLHALSHEVVPVRLDPELRAAIEARAETDDTNSSEIIRRALRAYLHVA